MFVFSNKLAQALNIAAEMIFESRQLSSHDNRRYAYDVLLEIYGHELE
jgi:hypothetical protein